MFEIPARKYRARKPTPIEDRSVGRDSKRNPLLYLSSRGIKAEIGKTIMSEISTRILRRHLQESELSECIAQKKKTACPEKKNRQNVKKVFATEILKQNTRFWIRFWILWSDELKFNLFQADGIRYSPNKALDSGYTVKV